MLLWTASNAAKNHGAVDVTEGPLLFSRVDCLRARSVEHTSSADKLISVVVIEIRLRVMAQVVFGTVGVGRTVFRLFRA